MRRVVFFVAGRPRPQGSHRGFVIPATETRKARAVVVPDNSRTRPWRADVRDVIDGIGFEPAPPGVPVAVVAVFALRRPKRHYTSRGLLSSAGQAAVAPTGKPDLDKLQRAVGDALKGRAYSDDSQIVDWTPRKRWTAGPDGLYVGVYVMPSMADAAPGVDAILAEFGVTLRDGTIVRLDGYGPWHGSVPAGGR